MRAVLAQLLQALAQGGVLAGAIARFEIGKAFEDAHAGIFGRAVVGKAQHGHQRDGRAVEIGQAPFGIRIAVRGGGLCIFPHHDDAGVGAEHAFGPRQFLARLLFGLSIFLGGAAGAI